MLIVIVIVVLENVMAFVIIINALIILRQLMENMNVLMFAQIQHLLQGKNVSLNVLLEQF